MKMYKKTLEKTLKILLEQKYTKLLIEASIFKTKVMTLEILRQPKTIKNEENIPFTTT